MIFFRFLYKRCYKNINGDGARQNRLKRHSFLALIERLKG
jgi:hypothetical protein